jgi:molecular chaperone GrpE
MEQNEVKTPEAEGAEAPKPQKEEKKKTKETKEAALKKEIEQLNEKVAKLEEDVKAEQEKYLRMLAEYDNFRRRAAAEKDGVYANATTDVLTAILPVVDNLELAMKYATEAEKVVKGVEMTLTRFHEILENLGISEIECETFDPNLHNAVMHIEDENYGEGQIVDVLQKGYKKGDKIIRYAMVRVAN